MEKNAKLILKERRYESNTKRHAKYLEEEELYRKDKFLTINEKRSYRRQYTKDHDKELDRLGYDRYKKDKRDVEEHVQSV